MLNDRLMNRFVPFLLLVAALKGLAIAQPAAPVASAEPTAATNLPPARWLLVVNTSAAMERRARAVEGIVGELLASGMRGELQPRDQIGLWLFNREFQAGVAPLQTWIPTQSNLIAGRTVGVLAMQKYSGTARFAPVLEEVQSLIAESHRLTVLILTDATATFTNTPWDAELNAAVAAEKAALEKTRMPLVIVLRGYKGKLIGHSVTLAPWPVEFPPFPPEPVVVAKVEPLPPPRPAGPPREIYIGPKPSPEPAPVLAPVITPVAVEATAVDAVPAVPAPEPAKLETVMSSPEPRAGADVTPAVRSNDLPLASAVPAPESRLETGAPTAALTVTPTPSNETPQPPVSAPPEPRPVKVATITNAPGTNLPVAAAQAPPTPREPPANVAAPKSSAVVAASPSAPPPRAESVNWLLIGGVGLLSIASGLAVLLALRSRRPAQASFITRSMARH